MNQCIKCGKEIPQGELFCLDCSLNPAVSLFDEPHQAERQVQPVGRMQTPKPVKRAPVRQATPVVVREKRKSRKGVIVALVLVSLLLAASLGLQVWQYGSMQVKENRLRAKEADLALRQTEIDELYDQLDALTLELETAEAAIEDKEQEIQDLTARLATSQSSQSQGQYDLTTKQQELERLEEENKQLLALSDDLELQIDEHKKTIADLESQLTDAQAYKTKSDFLDTYVVFVENDKTNLYHTYDCANFAKSSFWAYSRKLAEAQGFSPCPVCGGTP